mgnify:CR=1 FL=1
MLGKENNTSVNERLAKIEQQLVDNNHKLSALFELLNPLKDLVSKHDVHINWIARLGTIGLGLISLFSAWLAFKDK